MCQDHGSHAIEVQAQRSRLRSLFEMRSVGRLSLIEDNFLVLCKREKIGQLELVSRLVLVESINRSDISAAVSALISHAHTHTHSVTFIFSSIFIIFFCLAVWFQCFDTVGWTADKYIRPVNKQVLGCWCGYLSGVRCRLTYGPDDATATHCLSKIQIGFTFLVPAHLASTRQRLLNVCCCYC